MTSSKKLKIKKTQSKKQLKQKPDLDTYQFDTSKYLRLSSYKFKQSCYMNINGSLSNDRQTGKPANRTREQYHTHPKLLSTKKEGDML